MKNRKSIKVKFLNFSVHVATLLSISFVSLKLLHNSSVPELKFQLQSVKPPNLNYRI